MGRWRVPGQAGGFVDLGARQLPGGQVLGVPEVRATEVGAEQGRTDEGRAPQVGPGELGVIEPGGSERRQAQFARVEDRVGQIGTTQVRAPQVRPGEVDPGERGVEVEPPDDQPHEGGRPEVDTSWLGPFGPAGQHVHRRADVGGRFGPPVGNRLPHPLLRGFRTRARRGVAPGVLADEGREHADHGVVLLGRLRHDVFQAVYGSQPLRELVRGQKSDSRPEPLRHLAAPGESVRARRKHRAEQHARARRGGEHRLAHPRTASTPTARPRTARWRRSRVRTAAAVMR